MRSYTSLIRHEGNQELFFFTELSIIGLKAGMPIHVHVEGLRGTGKTTILRAASSFLPQSVRIKDCRFNCDPVKPHCPQHILLSKEQLDAVETEQVKIPFLEISHAAKIGTVVGTLDLKQLTNKKEPEAALLPGTLPQAHRGIVLVDEINRLADTAPELTDIMLDAMGTKPGRVQIEENGLPTVSLPLQISVWATSNPDEDPGSLADIRRQLSDRFDFTVQMGRPKEVRTLLAILSPELELAAIQKTVVEADILLGQHLAEMAEQVGRIKIPSGILESLAEVYIKHHFESLRSLEALKTGAVLAAARRNRQQVTWDDVLSVAPAALRHRISPDELTVILQELQREKRVTENPAWAAGSSALPEKASQSTRKSGQSKRSLSWWSRFMAWWNSLLGSRRDNRQQGTASTKDTDIQSKSARRKLGPSTKRSNPLDMPLVTPPAVARPLLELDISDAITVGEVDNDHKK